MFVGFYSTCSATSKGYWQIKDSNRKYFDTAFSGKIMDSISGFLIHFVVLKDFITTKPPPKSYVYKKFDNLDSNKLKADLHKIDWINEILK